MLFDSKSTNDFSSVPLLLCSDMSRGVKVESNDTKLKKKTIYEKLLTKKAIIICENCFEYFISCVYLVENFGSVCT